MGDSAHASLFVVQKKLPPAQPVDGSDLLGYTHKNGQRQKSASKVGHKGDGNMIYKMAIYGYVFCGILGFPAHVAVAGSSADYPIHGGTMIHSQKRLSHFVKNG